jgi:hypothetical protein
VDKRRVWSLGIELGGLDELQPLFLAARALDIPGDESGGMEAEFITEGDQTKLRLRSVETDGTPRNFYDTTVNITDPAFDTKQDVRLDQVAPGVYETNLGTLTPGAYALRFMQNKPGSTPLAGPRC